MVEFRFPLVSEEYGIQLKNIVFILLSLLFVVLASGCLDLAPSSQSNLSDDGGKGPSVSSPNFVATDLNYTSNDSRLMQEGNTVAGVFVSDYDNDGYPDILALGDQEPVLFENDEGGALTQSNSLPTLNTDFTSALFVDYDNDGWEDLYLINHQSSNKSSVFLENSRGEFKIAEVGLEFNYESPRGAAAADYNGDGCLDIFVIQAGNWLERRPTGFGEKVDISSDNGNRNRMFRGTCSGFVETTEQADIEGTTWSLATSFVDLNDDGLPDIHVANDFNNDVLYLNEGNGSFHRRMLPGYTDRNGMSSEIGDINGDGLPDIFVSNIHLDNESRNSVLESRYGDRIGGNNLLVNQGEGRFEDEADRYGLSEGYWGWSALVEDFDDDTDLEIYQAVSEGYSSFVHDDLYWDLSDGKYQRHVFDQGINTYGSATLDFDRDGRMDIITSSQKREFKLYLNRNDGGGWLQVELKNPGGTVLGTKVKVISEYGNQTSWAHSEVDYMSQSSRVMHFGLEDSNQVTVKAQWSDGTTTVRQVSINQRIEMPK